MKIKELRNFNDQQLSEKLAEYRRQLREHRFSLANNQLKAVRSVRETRAMVAKIMTILRQRKDQ